MMNFNTEMAALGAACLWAVSSVIYSRLGQRLPPLELNLLKGAIAIPLLVFTLYLSRDVLPSVHPTALCLLLLSGVIGISVGDTAFFATLNDLGARRALLIETLAPPIAAVIARIFLQERLSAGAWCGILLTILGVAWVIAERVPGASDVNTHWMRGIGFGLVAALSMATGAVLSHAVLATTEISPLWAALLRISAGVLLLLPSAWLRWQQRRFEIKALHLKVIGGVFLAAFIGTYLAIWMQQTALKSTAAGISLTLTSTSPLFVLLIAACMGERVSLRAILGVLIAIGGIGLLFSLR